MIDFSTAVIAGLALIVVALIVTIGIVLRVVAIMSKRPVSVHQETHVNSGHSESVSEYSRPGVPIKPIAIGVIALACVVALAYAAQAIGQLFSTPIAIPVSAPVVVTQAAPAHAAEPHTAIASPDSVHVDQDQTYDTTLGVVICVVLIAVTIVGCGVFLHWYTGGSLGSGVGNDRIPAPVELFTDAVDVDRGGAV